MNYDDLLKLVRKNEYLAKTNAFSNFWADQPALDNFIKSNRDRLVKEGAVVRIGRDLFIHVDQFRNSATKILSEMRREAA